MASMSVMCCSMSQDGGTVQLHPILLSCSAPSPNTPWGQVPERLVVVATALAGGSYVQDTPLRCENVDGLVDERVEHGDSALVDGGCRDGDPPSVGPGCAVPVLAEGHA